MTATENFKESSTDYLFLLNLIQKASKEKLPEALGLLTSSGSQNEYKIISDVPSSVIQNNL